ncbi:uncharacterized protein DS421_2g51190 [Arachis hypogaea]|nr:uncharacterized protein DS421_2g51190 [Arachis hypogaea]
MKFNPRRLPCPCGGQGRKLMLGASNWCVLVQPCASLVRPWCCPARAKGRAGKVDAPALRSARVGAARGGNWCARRKIGAPGAQNAALPAPRAGQERFGAPGTGVRALGAARGGNWCAKFVAWCAKFLCHPNAALPAPRAGQCPFLHVPSSNHGGGKHATFFLGFLAR